MIINTVGSLILFLNQILKKMTLIKQIKHEIFVQVWSISVQSALTTATAGFFVGAIMTIQFTLQMNEFGALGYLGGLSTSATIREIGPLLIAFMLAGKIGAFTAAELGTMKVTEQIDALRCLGADPMIEIIVPRFVGIVISSFFLLGMGLLMSFMGGTFFGRLFAGVNPEEYFRFVSAMVSGYSIVLGLLKCLIFSILIATICLFFGYTTENGAKAVGESVIKTSVYCMVSIVIADWAISTFFDSMLQMVGV